MGGPQLDPPTLRGQEEGVSKGQGRGGAGLSWNPSLTARKHIFIHSLAPQGERGLLGCFSAVDVF